MTFPLKSLANRSLKINGERVPPRRNGASDPIAEARPRIQCFHLCLRSSLPPRNQHPSIILRIWTECGYTLPAVRIENVGSSDCRASPVSTGPQIIFLWKFNFLVSSLTRGDAIPMLRHMSMESGQFGHLRATKATAKWIRTKHLTFGGRHQSP